LSYQQLELSFFDFFSDLINYTTILISLDDAKI
jgi:hypothetical protein